MDVGGCNLCADMWWLSFTGHQEKNKVSEGLTVSSAVTFAYLFTAKWCFESKRF